MKKIFLGIRTTAEKAWLGSEYRTKYGLTETGEQALVPAIAKGLYGMSSALLAGRFGNPVAQADAFHDLLVDSGMVLAVVATQKLQEKLKSTQGQIRQQIAEVLDQKVLPSADLALHAFILFLYGKISVDSFVALYALSTGDTDAQNNPVAYYASLFATATAGVFVNNFALACSNTKGFAKEFAADKILSISTAVAAGISTLAVLAKNNFPETEGVQNFANGAYATGLLGIAAVTAERCRGIVAELCEEIPEKMPEILGQWSSSIAKKIAPVGEKMAEVLEKFDASAPFEKIHGFFTKNIRSKITGILGFATLLGALGACIPSPEKPLERAVQVPVATQNFAENSAPVQSFSKHFPTENFHTITTLAQNDVKNLWKLAQKISQQKTSCVSDLLQAENRLLDPKKISDSQLIVVPSGSELQEKCGVSFQSNQISASSDYIAKPIPAGKNPYSVVKTQFPQKSESEISCRVEEALKTSGIATKDATKIPANTHLIVPKNSTCDGRKNATEQKPEKISFLQKTKAKMKEKFGNWWASFSPQKTQISAFEKRMADFQMPSREISFA